MFNRQLQIRMVKASEDQPESRQSVRTDSGAIKPSPSEVKAIAKTSMMVQDISKGIVFIVGSYVAMDTARKLIVMAASHGKFV